MLLRFQRGLENKIHERITHSIFRLQEKINNRRKRSALRRKVRSNFCFFISYPRSGHHLLVRCLRLYYKPLGGLPKKEYKNTPDHNQLISFGPHTYCNFEHCKVVGCTHVDTTIQKNHDFRLGQPVIKKCMYLVQYRHPFESIISWYQRYCKANKIPKHKISQRHFNLFYFKNIEYWQKFISKWVLSQKSKKVKKINVLYHHFIHNPKQELKKVIEYLEPGHIVDDQRLEQVFKTIEVKKTRDIRQFEFYNEKFFSFEEKRIAHLLQRANIPFIFESTKKRQKSEW